MKLTLAKITLLTLCVLIALPADAVTTQVRRNVQFNNLTTEAGLSAEHVHDVVQDRQGYIWFASQAGLNRFDGYEIVVFENDPTVVTTLSNNFVRALYVDDNGELWAGTHKGVNKYDYETETFDRNPLQLPVDMEIRVRKIVQDSTGVFWIGSLDQGLYAVDARTGELRHYVADPAQPGSLPHNHVMGLIEDLK